DLALRAKTLESRADQPDAGRHVATEAGAVAEVGLIDRAAAFVVGYRLGDRQRRTKALRSLGVVATHHVGEAEGVLVSRQSGVAGTERGFVHRDDTQTERYGFVVLVRIDQHLAQHVESARA